MGESIRPELDNDDDDIIVSLVDARVAPGVEVKDLLGHSLAGRSLIVVACNGTATIKIGREKTVLTSLVADQYGTLEFVALSKKIIRTKGVWNDDDPRMPISRYPKNDVAPGTKVTIAGSVGNDGTYTVDEGSTATDLVVEEALADEAASATETVTGYRPKTGKAIAALTWPATVEVHQEFAKVFVENADQVGKSMTLAIGRRF
jgi:hypothetical protein